MGKKLFCIISLLFAGLVSAGTSMAAEQMELGKGAARLEAPAAATPLHSAKEFLGVEVRDQSNNEIGQVQDILIDFGGQQPTYAVISPSGAMEGEGRNYYLAPLSALTSAHEGNYVTLNMERNRLVAVPRPSPEISDEEFRRDIYERGVSRMWEDLPGDVPIRREEIPGENLTYPGPREVIDATPQRDIGK